MTTINDTIRQASLYTMNGLIDPRLVAQSEPSKSKRTSKSFLERLIRIQIIRRRFSWR